MYMYASQVSRLCAKLLGVREIRTDLAWRFRVQLSTDLKPSTIRQNFRRSERNMRGWRTFISFHEVER